MESIIFYANRQIEYSLTKYKSSNVVRNYAKMMKNKIQPKKSVRQPNNIVQKSEKNVIEVNWRQQKRQKTYQQSHHISLAYNVSRGREDIRSHH